MTKLPLKQNKILASVIATTLAAAVGAPTASWAQSADATLRGKAPANARVTARNLATGSSRSTQASADGTYVLVGLPPGLYKVDAGAGTERAVTLAVASTSTLDLVAGGSAGKVDAGDLADITVKSQKLVEVKTSEIGTVVSVDQIASVPQITRNFLEFADTVPGIVFSVDSNGNTSIQSGAQANSSINVYIDGIGQKNYVKSGGISGQAGPSGNGDPGNPFPQLAISEYKVITSNYKAEYDQLSSAAITAQTKSGTNEFHGEVFGDYTGEKFRSATPAEEAAGGHKPSSTSKEWGAAVGGPIMKDVAHFFATWEHKEFNLPNSVNPPGALLNANLESILPASVYSQFGPSVNPFKEDLYFAKVDVEPSENDRIEASVKYRKENEQLGASGQTAASAAFNFNNDDTRIAVKWQHATDRWINEATATYEKTVDNPTPLSNEPAITYTWFGPPAGSPTDIITINGQDPRQYTDKHQSGKGIQDDLTFSNVEWHGSHTFKMGAKIKSVELVARDGSDAAKYWYGVSAAGVADSPFQVVYGKVNNGLPLAAVSDNKQFGVYFQDDWAVDSHLTLNLGVRWDYEKTPSFTDYVTPANVLAALNSPYPAAGAGLPQPTSGETYLQALALGGINMNDYISNGHNRSDPKGNIAPRLGFSYDLDGDQKHVIFGGIGRAYDRNLFDRLQLENSKNALSEPSILFYNSGFTFNNGCANADAANGTTCLAWDPKYLNPANLQALGNGVGEVDVFPNKIKTPYSDQFSIGMRNKIGDWNTSASIARINSYDGILGTLGNRYADGSFAAHGCGLDWGGSPAQWCSSGVPGIGSLIVWRNGQNTRTTEVLLSAEKPYTRDSHWGATVAYTYTDAKQNRLYNDGYAFDLPTLGDYPYTLSSAVAIHRLVATGTVDGPWGLLFAGKLTLSTPIPYTSILGCSQLGSPNGTSCNAAGSNAYPAAAKFNETLGYKALDLQVTKNFEVGSGYTLYARIDALNVTNAQNFDSTAGSWNYPSAPQYNKTGPIIGVPRTLKFTIGGRF
jgi:outer membrane receptor protein involved in Fe transport